MPRLDVYSRIFLIGALLHVAGLFLGRPPAPWSGVAAVVALAGLIWTRPVPPGAGSWTRPVLIAGFAALAFVVAQPHGDGLAALGQARSALVPAPADDLVVAGVAAVACGAIAAGVLGRTPWLFRPTAVPALAVTALVIGSAALLGAAPVLALWAEADSPTSRLAVVFFPALATILGFLAVAVVLTVVAVVTSLASRGLRAAGAGLLPLMVVAISLMPAVLDDDRLTPPSDPYDHGSVSVLTYEVETYHQDLIDANTLSDRHDRFAYYRNLRPAEPAPEEWSPVGEGGTDLGGALVAGMFLFCLATPTTSLVPHED